MNGDKVDAPLFTEIETARLLVRHFRESDLPAFVAYRNDPAVARYQSWGAALTEERASVFIDEMKSARPGVPGEWFQFAVALKTTGGLIGDCGLRVNIEEPRQAEIGYGFASEHQGNGYATEAIAAVLDFAFGALGLHRVHAYVICENVRSVDLLERLGMRREAHFLEHYWHHDAWVDEYEYAILEREWLARAG